jgi:hypothetical protein
MELIEEDFCFRRLTVTGRVSRLNKGSAHGICGLSFWLTVERAPRPTKVLRVCGEIWGPQLAMAEQIEEGSLVTLIGCLKEPDLAATIQLPGLDLEQVLEVA